MHQPCEPATEKDYWFDAIMQTAVDGVPAQAVINAAEVAETGQEANIAIWAAIKLNELTRSQGMARAGV